MDGHPDNGVQFRFAGFLVQVQVQVYMSLANLGLLLASVQVPQEILTNLCDSVYLDTLYSLVVPRCLK